MVVYSRFYFKRIIFSFIFVFFCILFILNNSYSVNQDQGNPFYLEGDFLIDSKPAPIGTKLNTFVNGESYNNISSYGTGDYVTTINGFTGNEVQIAVCGILQKKMRLISFGTKVVDINADLENDGIKGCSCDEICRGGFCINPGFSKGVCSSKPYYCNHNGICDVEYGETAKTCRGDCVSNYGSDESVIVSLDLVDSTNGNNDNVDNNIDIIQNQNINNINIVAEDDALNNTSIILIVLVLVFLINIVVIMLYTM